MMHFQVDNSFALLALATIACQCCGALCFPATTTRGTAASGRAETLMGNTRNKWLLAFYTYLALVRASCQSLAPLALACFSHSSISY